MTTLIPKFEQTGSTVNRAINLKLQDFVSAKDFGAVGNGVADDTTAIQNAVNSFGASSGSVYLTSGTYLVSSTISIPSNVTLFGDNDATTIKRNTSVTPFDIFIVLSTNNITFANFVIDGVAKLDNATVSNRYSAIRILANGGAMPNNITIDGIYIKSTTSGEIQSEGNRGAITLEDCYNVQVQNCRFYDNRATAILMCVKSGSTNTTSQINITNCWGIGEIAPFASGFPNGFGSMISGQNHSDVIVSNCYANGFGFSNISMNGPRSVVQNCISVNSNFANFNLGHNSTGNNCDNSVIDGCVAYNSKLEGIAVAGSKNLVISNNLVNTCGTTSGRNGVAVLYDSGYVAGETILVTIVGNQIYNSTGGNGLYVEAGTQIQINGNTVANSVATGIYMRQQLATGEDMVCYVSDNFLYNNGTDNAAIQVQADTTDGFTTAIITNNFITSSSITNYQQYGIAANLARATIQVNNNWFSAGYTGTLNTTYSSRATKALNQFSGASLINANIFNV